MAEYLIQEESLTELADAIREKTGGTEQIAVSDMRSQILGLYGKNDVETVTVEPDFSAGDYVVTPSADGKVLGQVTVAKPENLLPGNIAEGVDIAGIVGKLATDGNNAKVAFGTFTGTGAKLTINHDLGVVPDFVSIIQIDGTRIESNKYYGGWSMSSGLMELTNPAACAHYYTGYYYNYTSYLKVNSVSKASNALVSTSATACINSATETTFDTPPLCASRTFAWIAIGGLT